VSAALAPPPGPGLPSPVQAALWGVRGDDWARSLRRRHGSTYTVRLGGTTPLVMTSDRDAVRRLLTGDPLGKAHGNDVLRPMLGDRSVLLLPPAEHLARRRLLLPPFHGERVDGYVQLMRRLVEERLDAWRPGEVRAVLPLGREVALDVILQAVLGVSDPALRDRIATLVDDLVTYPTGELRRRLPTRGAAEGTGLPGRRGEVAGRLATLASPAVMTFFPTLKRRSWKNPSTLHWFTLYDRVLALLDEHVQAVRRDPRLEEREDILAMLVRARDEEGEGLTDADLRDELWAIINAGHETTATVTAWGSLLLAHRPAVQGRAAEALAAGDRTYLQAVVKECLRFRTPLQLSAARTLAEPFESGGTLVPAGWTIGIDALALHEDPEAWGDPAVFRPERFLEGPAPAYAFLPFGGGAHRCIGAALAELEVEVALGALLERFELRPAEPRMEAAIKRAIVHVPHAGARVRLEARASGG